MAGPLEFMPLEGARLAAALVSLAAAGLLLAVAAGVLAANARRASNQLFALFLVLVAGNAVMDGLLKLSVPGPGATTLDRLGLAFLILDPGVLRYLAATYPRRTRLADHAAFAIMVVGTWAGFGLLLATAPERFPFPRTTPGGHLSAVGRVRGAPCSA